MHGRSTAAACSDQLGRFVADPEPIARRERRQAFPNEADVGRGLGQLRLAGLTPVPTAAEDVFVASIDALAWLFGGTDAEPFGGTKDSSAVAIVKRMSPSIRIEIVSANGDDMLERDRVVEVDQRGNGWNRPAGEDRLQEALHR